MRVEGLIFSGVCVFLGIVTVVYWFLSYDPTGTTALALASGLALIIGYYCLFTSSRIDRRPEDRGDADISDGAGEMGFFSPHSHWPIVLAGGFTVAAFGIVFGAWLLVIGVFVIALGGLGLLFEYYAGS